MVVMMVMVKMVKIENGKKEKYSIIYNIYIYLYYSVKMALPKIDFDQNDHDHFDHDAGALSIAIRAKKIEKDRKKFVDRNEILLPLPRREMSV